MDEEAKNIKLLVRLKKINLNSVMSNSFGFGGTNAALIFEKDIIDGFNEGQKRINYGGS